MTDPVGGSVMWHEIFGILFLFQLVIFLNNYESKELSYNENLVANTRLLFIGYLISCIWNLQGRVDTLEEKVKGLINRRNN